MNYHYSFSKYLKDTHNERLWRLPLSTGYPCPNRIDGKTGCTFCDGISFLPKYLKEEDSLLNHIERGIKFFSARYKVDFFYGYFQFNSSTYGDINDLINKYKIVLNHPKMKGLIISTRPDFIYKEIIDEIKKINKDLKKDIWIEMGLQTVYDETLKRINRNHTYEEFKKAIQIIQDNSDFKITVHMIIGLPNEKPEKIINGTKKLFNENKIDGVKFRLLEILDNTLMKKDFDKNPNDFYKFDFKSYADLICSLLEVMPEKTVIMRMTNFKSLRIISNDKNKINSKLELLEEIENEFKRRNTRQGYYFNKE